MTIHVFSIVWNNEAILPAFLEHYSKFANRIFIIDDHSTDLTAGIAKAHPMVTYLEYEHSGLNEDEFNSTFETLVKKYPSDWAVVADSDEFIDISYLDKLERGKVYKTRSYMMIGKTGRLEDCKEVRWKPFDKPVVFDPTLDIHFGPGRHTCNLPTEPGPNLFHYKYPSRELYLERNLEGYKRIAGMDEAEQAKRIKKGLAWYDSHI